MQAQPTTIASRIGPSRSRGRRGQARLAPLPDPALETALERDAAARARETLAAAAATGSPLLAIDGRRRSPITLPEYRRGRSPGNKGKRYPAEILTPEEVAALLEAYPARTAFGARQRALIVVMWRAGLRIAEALALEPKHVDLEHGVIAVACGKGAKPRAVGIDPYATAYLREWAAERAALGVAAGAPLFCTISRDAGGTGRPLHSSTVRESLKRYAKRAGISKPVRPHGLRHSCAYELATEGVPLVLIRAQLGHVDLETTQRYIDHLAPQTLIAAMRERTWPGHGPVPPATSRAARSNGRPARLTGDPPAAPANPEDQPLQPSNRVGGRAAVGQTKREILHLVRGNGGRASQRQLSRALRLTLETVHRHCTELAAAGELSPAGKDGRPGGQASTVWALPPLLATFRVQPHLKLGGYARRGSGAQRVLDALAAAGGRASQAQLAGALGITPSTIAKHCQLLKLHGVISAGGLDKATSNRGSRVWALPANERWHTAAATLRPPPTSTSTSDTMT